MRKDISHLLLKIYSDNYHDAIHAAIDLTQDLKIASIDDLIKIVAPSRQVSTDIFDLCCDAFQVVERVRENRSKVPNEPPKGVSNRI